MNSPRDVGLPGGVGSTEIGGGKPSAVPSSLCRQPRHEYYIIILIPSWQLHRACLAVCYLHSNAHLGGSPTSRRLYIL